MESPESDSHRLKKSSVSEVPGRNDEALSRRKLLRGLRQLSGGLFAISAGQGVLSDVMFSELSAEETEFDTSRPLPVAAVVTEYRPDSHADVILGKILEGYDQKRGPGPALKLVSIFTDQVPEGDLSRALAEKYGFRIAKTIDEALTLGTNRLQVSGVLSIGEHGEYPLTPQTKQRMYPRKRFFDEITKTFERVGQVVPVFNDKHLAWSFADARLMYDTSQSMKFPLLAGSSLPVAWRRPALELPRGCRIESALGVGYGGAEDYGFHALETLQCLIERRADGETGVQSVQAFQGDQVIAARDRGELPMELFSAVLNHMPGKPAADLSRLRPGTCLYRIHYRDGLRAAVVMADGIASQFGGAVQLSGDSEIRSSWFQLEESRPFGHFAHLLRAIEFMIHTGRTPYPVERTLLTTGILDALMHSLAENGELKETPELGIRYQAGDWPFANQKDLTISR